MRLPRFTILQLLLVTALCGLFAGWVTQAWRAGSHYRLTVAEISPDGKRLAAAYDGGDVEVWDISGSRPRKVASLQSNGVYLQGMCFVDAGSLVMYQLGGRGSELAVWDISRNRQRTMVRANDPFLAWDVSLDGTTAVSSSYQAAGTGTAIEVWDLTTGLPKTQFKIVGSPYFHKVAIDAQAKVVAATDASNNKLCLLDAKTGQPIRDFPPAFNNLPWALAHDGNIAAIGDWLGPSGPVANEVRILIYDLRKPEENPQELRVVVPFFRALLSRDGSRLALSNPHGIEVWNVRSGERLWYKEEGINFHPSMANFSLMIDSWRLSADGSRVVGLTGRDGIAVYDAATGSRLHLLGGFNRPLHAAMYSVAFIGWAVAWGLVVRRQRLRESAAGVVLPAPVRHSPWRGVAWLLAIMLVITFAYATVSSQALAGRFSLWRFFSSAGTILGLIFLAIAAVVAIQFVYAWAFPAGFARRQARLLTREQGRHVSYGMLHGWFLGQSTVETDFPRHVEEVRRQLSELLGREIVLRYPLLVIGVEHQDQFDKLHARHMAHGAISVQRWWVDEVRICQEALRRYAASPFQGLRNAAALALVRRYWRLVVPQWLGTALIGYASREDRYEADVRQSLRLLRMLAPGRLKELWDQLFGYSIQEWSRLVLAKESADELRHLSELNALANSLAAFFLLSPVGDRREKFIKFVRSLGRKDDVDESFSRQFGQRPVELFDQWQAWLDEQPLAPIDPPRPESAAHVRQSLLPQIANPHVPIDQRRRSVVALAASGDLAAADTLVAILADEASPLQADALWTLRALTGYAGDENVEPWREWLSTAGSQLTGQAPAASPAWPQDLSFEEPVQAELADTPAGYAVTATAPSLVDRLNNPPWQLGVARLLWGIGGVWGIIAAASLSFYIALPMVLPFLGGVLLVGLATLSRAAGRLWWGLNRLPAYQMGCFFSCEPVNAVCGLFTAFLVRSAAVKDYLRSVGGS